MRRFTYVSAVCLALIAFVFTYAGHAGRANAADDYLNTIKARGYLMVGVKNDSPPYGSLNPATNQPEGFDVDMSHILAAKLLGSPDKVKFTGVTTANRIPLLQQGDIDLILATMTITAERAKIIDFSTPYYPSGDGALVAANSTIQKPTDLNGKIACFTTGTASKQFMDDDFKKLKIAERSDLVLSTYPECAQALKVGRADFVFTDYGTMVGIAQEISGLRVLPTLFDTQDWGVGVSKAHPELVSAVNAAIKKSFADGSWLADYKKWLKADPPKGWPPK